MTSAEADPSGSQASYTVFLQVNKNDIDNRVLALYPGHAYSKQSTLPRTSAAAAGDTGCYCVQPEECAGRAAADAALDTVTYEHIMASLTKPAENMTTTTATAPSGDPLDASPPVVRSVHCDAESRQAKLERLYFPYTVMGDAELRRTHTFLVAVCVSRVARSNSSMSGVVKDDEKFPVFGFPVMVPERRRLKHEETGSVSQQSHGHVDTLGRETAEAINGSGEASHHVSITLAALVGFVYLGLSNATLPQSAARGRKRPRSGSDSSLSPCVSVGLPADANSDGSAAEAYVQVVLCDFAFRRRGLMKQLFQYALRPCHASADSAPARGAWCPTRGNSDDARNVTGAAAPRLSTCFSSYMSIENEQPTRSSQDSYHTNASSSSTQSPVASTSPTVSSSTALLTNTGTASRAESAAAVTRLVIRRFRLHTLADSAASQGYICKYYPKVFSHKRGGAENAAENADGSEIGDVGPADTCAGESIKTDASLRCASLSEYLSLLPRLNGFYRQLGFEVRKNCYRFYDGEGDAVELLYTLPY